MSVLARWCFRHRYIVIGLWVAVFAVLFLSGTWQGSKFGNGFSVPGTDSTKAMSLLSTAFHGQAGDADTIVFATQNGRVDTPAVEARVTSLLAQVAKVPEVGAVQSPFTTGGPGQISQDGKVAFATVTFTKQSFSLDKANVQKVVDLGSALRSSTLQVEFGGSAIGLLAGVSTSTSELVGLLAAAIVLFIAFGSLLSMAIPLIAAIFALGSAVFLIDLLSHVVSIGTIAPTIAALVGLGVGIDYALFIVTRHRNGIQAGLTPEEAAVTAMDTSGRAVIFAGATVLVAMLGLLLLRVGFLTGIGIAAAVMIAVAVVVAATLLPALFGVFGTRLLSRRQRRRLAQDGPVEVAASGPWARWASFVQKRPFPLVVIATAIMAVLAVPFFSLRLGSSDAGNNPTTDTTRRAYDLLAQGFGAGYNGPLQLVASVPDTAATADLIRLESALKAVPGVASVRVGPSQPGATVVIMSVTPTASPQSVQTSTLIDTLRRTVIPPYEQDGLKVYVGGQTATFKDFASVIGSKLPLFIVIIVALGFLLLVLAFRSVLVPLTAAVMNLLSAGAAFGVVVAVFQWGWGSSLLNAGAAGPIESFLPAMMLAILFGLSMDYEVFLVSRIHEEWVHTQDNKVAVRRGQVASGRVITAAAVIMICVFGAFVFGGQRTIAEFGLGLAVAILLDALIVRTILVPAVMQLFGRANWWLPTSIDRILPHLSVEPEDTSHPAAHERTLAPAGNVPAISTQTHND